VGVYAGDNHSGALDFLKDMEERVE